MLLPIPLRRRAMDLLPNGLPEDDHDAYNDFSEILGFDDAPFSSIVAAFKWDCFRVALASNICNIVKDAANCTPCEVTAMLTSNVFPLYGYFFWYILIRKVFFCKY